MLRSEKSCVDSVWGREHQQPGPSFPGDSYLIFMSVRSSVFRHILTWCERNGVQQPFLVSCKAFYSLSIWKWREMRRNLGVCFCLACCCEIMWKCFHCFLVTHEWLCLEHVLREHMLLLLLLFNYRFLCCLPTAPTSVRFWSEAPEFGNNAKKNPTNTN